MLSALIITLRETLEAALVVGIVLAFLTKTNRNSYSRTVWFAVASALVASGVFALLFTLLAGEFEGTAEMIFEGTTMLFAAVLLTSMIFWMLRQRNIKNELEEEIATEVERKHKRGVFLVVFAAVFREGVETVIFLAAAVTSGGQLLGGLLGAIIAVVIGYGVFTAAVRVNLKKFFTITSVLLLLFAAGLAAKGVGEYQEANLLPTIVDHVWNINPAQNIDGTYPLWHENGALGGVLSDLFGYNASPSLLQVIIYVVFVGVIGWRWRKAHVVV